MTGNCSEPRQDGRSSDIHARDTTPHTDHPTCNTRTRRTSPLKRTRAERRQRRAHYQRRTKNMAALGFGIMSFEIDGKRHALDFASIKASEWKQIKAHTGKKPLELMSEIDDPRMPRSRLLARESPSRERLRDRQRGLRRPRLPDIRRVGRRRRAGPKRLSARERKAQEAFVARLTDTEDIWALRCTYLGYFVRQCHLSPSDVDDMGWLDLIGLTIMADEEIDAYKREQYRAKEAELAALA